MFSFYKVVLILLLTFNCFNNVHNSDEISVDAPFFLFPDDVRFAERRCQEEFSQGNSQLIEQWQNYEFPDDNLTHCYIKCYLLRLGLLNLVTRGFEYDKISMLWENMDLETSENCIKVLDFGDEMDDKCVSYYNKWMQLRNKCNEPIKNLFYELGPNYQYRMKYQPQSKALGVSATEFCRNLEYQESYNPTAYSQDTTEINMTFNKDCQHVCIFIRFHYFDAYQRLDEKEIIRSFNEALNNTITNQNVIKSCVHQANALFSTEMQFLCKMAFELNQCLLERFGEIFQYVKQYRNNLSVKF